VQGGEDQVPGERRLDGDGPGFQVPDLPNHDDVGVLPQERPERRGEAHPDLVSHLHLVDPVEVVLHRVLRRHDVHLVGVHLGQRRVEGGGLPGPRGTRHQHHPVRVGDGVHEVLLRLLLEAELGQVEGQVPLVQDTEHDLLAEDHREGGDPEIHHPVLHPQLDAPVLGNPSLGDVEVRQDLDAGRDPGLHLHGRLHHLHERPVDPVADPYLLLVRLDVDVGGPLQHGVGEEAVDELHHRRLLDLLLQRRDRDVVLLVLGELHVVGRQVRQDLRHPLVRGVVVLLQVLPEGELPGHHGLDLGAGDELEDVDGRQVRGGSPWPP
jgi:hypothetical protein